MRFKLLIVSILFCFTASAQIYDSTTLRNYINANIVPNSTRSITATQLNNSLIGLLNVDGRYKVDSIWKNGDSILYSIGGVRNGILVTGGRSVDSGWISNDTLRLHKASGGMIAIKMHYYTTEESDARYLQGFDTASLSGRIANKVNISDTASMLSAYLHKGDTASLSNRINLTIPISQKAAANGVATLGSDGKVLPTQLPSGAQVYKGTWDASTNTPTLVDGVGTAGWTYRVAVAGTVDLGSGDIAFAPGDDIIYSGTMWQRNPNGATVSSVNGEQGAVVLSTDDIEEGATNEYYTDDKVHDAEIDPSVPSDVKAITSTNISNWSAAFGWGDHAAAGYLTATAGDARYPKLSSSYANPSWLASLPWSKITSAPAFITGNQTITVTGAATGFGTTTIPLTLANSGVTAGTYNSLTVNSKGLITAGTHETTLAGIGIADAYTKTAADARYPLLSGAYNNPSWLTGLAWSKITGEPTTLFGYGITDAAPVSGSGNYIWNQTGTQQTGSNFWINGRGVAYNFQTTSSTSDADITLHSGSLGNGTQNRRWSIYKSVTEATGNEGNDFTIGRYDNTGVALGTPLIIKRSTGVVTMTNGLLTKNGSGIIGTSSGTANNSFLNFYEANGTTRVGYVGKGSTSNSDIYIASDNGGIALSPAGTGGAPTVVIGSSAMNFNAGVFSLTNSTSNLIIYNSNGIALPTFTTRSPGTKITLFSNTSSSTVDYSLGIASQLSWSTVPQSTAAYGWGNIAGTTMVSRLSGLGQLEVAAQGRFKGWYSSSTNNLDGPAAEIGYFGGHAAVMGYDRTASKFLPLQLQAGSSTTTSSTLQIDGSGYSFLQLPSVGALGTNSTGYLIDVSGNFAPSNISLAGVLANGNTAPLSDIKLGGSGVTPQRALSVTRSISGTDYTATFAIGAGGGTYVGSNSGAISRLIYLRTSQAYPEFSTDGGTTLYPMYHSGNSNLTSVPWSASTLTATNFTAPSSSNLKLTAPSGQETDFYLGATQKMTLSANGLGIGITPTSVRASPLQVAGNIWSEDAFLLGPSGASVPIAEFGLSGASDAFVRTMGTGDITFQTSASTVRAKVNGTTGNFEVPLTVKAGAIDVNGSAAISGSGVASFSSVTAPSVNATSTLHVGAVYTKTRTLSGNGTIAADDYTLLLYSPSGTGGTYTLTLPNPASYEGRELEFWAASGVGSWTTNYNIDRIAGPAFNTIIGGEKIKVINGVWKILYKSTY